jgi:hypothetical protein
MSKLKGLCLTAGCLMMLWASSAQAVTHNILLIHGRHDDHNDNPGQTNVKELYGTFSYDQLGYWEGIKPGTADGHVYFVQWDADHKYFDDSNWPGGQAVIQDAVNQYCQYTAAAGYQECYIICHSAGCAAFEYFMQADNYCCNADFFAHVMEAGSAAGGSEVASWSGLWPPGSMTIDGSLVPSYARGHGNLNNMLGVVFRAIAGTYNESLLSRCKGVWPTQWVTGTGPNCATCVVSGNSYLTECTDDAVPLHSSCGHSRDASFIDCNSTLTPYNDTAGTYSYHGFWIHDNICDGQGGSGCSWIGPYSPNSQWNSGYHTYHVNHGGTIQDVIKEYGYGPYGLVP